MDPEANTSTSTSTSTNGGGAKKDTKKGKKSKYSGSTSAYDPFKPFREAADSVLSIKEGILTKRAIALLVLVLAYLASGSFTKYCWQQAEGLSNPTIIQKARLSNGIIMISTEYRDAYSWLKDNTPSIRGSWHGGIMVTRLPVSPTEQPLPTATRGTTSTLPCWKRLCNLDTGWEISRYGADYVLIWSGNEAGDDLGKSPHLARICKLRQVPTAHSDVPVVDALCA
jgi:hypothetical protein